MFSLKQKEINNLNANFLLILLLTLFSTYFRHNKISQSETRKGTGITPHPHPTLP